MRKHSCKLWPLYGAHLGGVLHIVSAAGAAGLGQDVALPAQRPLRLQAAGSDTLMTLECSAGIEPDVVM